jgi:alpha-tubulin suppressor-like RCC1 family protein
VLCIFGSLGSSFAGGNGTFLILQNPTNSSPRMASVWGGAGSEQIILKSDRTVWDWGFNLHAQLGNGTIGVNTDFPGQVLGQGGVGYLDSIAAIIGGESHNMAVKSDGTTWGWGDNGSSELGIGTTGGISTVPVQVLNMSNVVSVSGGDLSSMARLTTRCLTTVRFQFRGLTRKSSGSTARFPISFFPPSTPMLGRT